ncbi:hypothetical protein F5Y14DRAFT_26165 [Nemania sp. NC0429]|nr:hypothetical protein F5Y14DRAFT_26165 [Nemania sp. NC0429]
MILYDLLLVAYIPLSSIIFSWGLSQLGVHRLAEHPRPRDVLALVDLFPQPKSLPLSPTLGSRDVQRLTTFLSRPIRGQMTVYPSSNDNRLLGDLHRD